MAWVPIWQILPILCPRGKGFLADIPVINLFNFNVVGGLLNGTTFSAHRGLWHWCADTHALNGCKTYSNIGRSILYNITYHKWANKAGLTSQSTMMHLMHRLLSPFALVWSWIPIVLMKDVQDRASHMCRHTCPKWMQNTLKYRLRPWDLLYTDSIRPQDALGVLVCSTNELNSNRVCNL